VAGETNHGLATLEAMVARASTESTGSTREGRFALGAEWAICVAMIEDVSRTYRTLTDLLLEAVAEDRRNQAAFEKRLLLLEEAVFGKVD